MRPPALPLAAALVLSACASTLEDDGWLAASDTSFDLSTDAMRGRAARVDVPFVAGAGTPAAFGTEALRTLPLFEDLVVDVELDRLSQHRGTTTWTGHVAGWPHHEVVLTRTRGGAVSGIVRAPEATVRLRPLGPGLVAVEEVGTRLGSVDLEPIVPLGLPAGEDALASLRDGPGEAPIIDVLLVATALTGTTLGGEEGLESAAAALIAQANKGYADSGLATRLRLAGVHLSDWDEDGFDWSEALYDLPTDDDGVMDDVPDARDAVGADLVSVLVDGDGGACGLGFLMSPARPSFASAAYSMVDLRCASSNLSFPHEVGHNLGLHHDRANAVGTPATSFAYGYQDPDDAFRTVMSYDCDDARCPRLNLWSNPDKEVDGAPAGVAITAEDAAHNVASIGITAPIAAAFRTPVEDPDPEAAALVSPASGSTLSGESVAVAWTDVGADGYTLTLGSTAGTNDIASIDAGTSTATLVTGLPTDGRTIHATLWSDFDGEFLTSSATWTAAAPAPRVASLDSPTPGTMLAGTRATFSWDDVEADGYAIVLGSTRFGSDLGTFATSATSLTISGLPDDGRTLWVSLYTQDGDRWRSETVTYQAYDADVDTYEPASLLEPTAGSTLRGTSLTFRWTNPGAERYALTLYVDGTEVYHEIVSGTAATVTLPTDTPEGELTARLSTDLGGFWYSRTTSYAYE